MNEQEILDAAKGAAAQIEDAAAAIARERADANTAGFCYARCLEGAAQGLSVHETLAALEDQGMGLSEGSSACCDVACALRAEGIEDEDLDPSWIRLRDWLKRSGGRG